MGLTVAKTRSYWLEEMPSPWDADCRGKFKIYEYRFDPDRFSNSTAEGKYRIFGKIREELESSGKLQFCANNGIDFYKSFKFATFYHAVENEVSIYVLVDMPKELRTLYTLTFTE